MFPVIQNEESQSNQWLDSGNKYPVSYGKIAFIVSNMTGTFPASSCLYQISKSYKVFCDIIVFLLLMLVKSEVGLFQRKYFSKGGHLSPIASRSIFTSIQYSESEEDCSLNTILQTTIHIDGRWMVMLHVKLPTENRMVG